MSRQLLVALSLAGAAVTVAAAALVLFAHDFEPYGSAEEVAQVVGDGIWIATGLIAWQRRPGNRVGPLMTAVGFVGLVSLLYWDSALPFTVGKLASFFQLPIGLHLFLAFPSGRLSTRFERWFVAFMYVAVYLWSLILRLFSDARGTDCPDCPRNLLLVHSDAGVASVVGAAGFVLLMAILLTAVVLIVRHVRSARGLTRRALAPVLLTAAAAAMCAAALLVLMVLGRETAATVLLWAFDVVSTAVPVAFLIGLLRTRLQRSGVADLVVELGSLPPPARVRAAIAHALGDDSLELGFWLPAEHRYVDGDGNALDPAARSGRALTVLEPAGERLAVLVHDPSLLDDPELVEAVGAAASLALENSRLQAELRARLAEVRASRARIVAAADAERRRLERDLHDGAQQRLLGIRLALQLARGHAGDQHAIEELLAEADAEVLGALEELRALARGIHPAILTEDGLAAALSGLARRAPVPVELRLCAERMSAPVEATAYFVAGEALANVVKHAHATRVTIDVTRSNGAVAVEITDDGTGGADANGAGLRGLRDRVEALDGDLQVDSPSSGGTRVTAAIPCA